MKKLKIPLTAVALMIGIAGAFATSISSHQSQQHKKFALNQTTQQWVDVTGQTQGVDYLCNSSSETCTAEFTNDDPNTGTIIPGTQVLGDYQP